MQPDDTLYRQGLEHYERNEFDQAGPLFERLLAGNPGHVEARYKLANVRKEQGDWRAAAFHYETLLRLQASHAEALNNLGAVYQNLGRWSEAEGCYRKSIGVGPALAQPCMNLGRLLQSQGRDPEAHAVYRSALERGLDAGLFGHLLAATSGGSVPKASLNYVRETFDAFAGDFDRHLLEDLDYEVPRQLAALVRNRVGGNALDALDLGCGTGLSGEALASALGGATLFLAGVDISPRMLEIARARGCYHELDCADIESWLVQAPAARFDVVLAADVFIYVGALDSAFAGVRRALRPSGLFAFSVERLDDEANDGWKLLASGRYAQSADYLRRLAQQNGFRLIEQKPARIRRGVPGELYLLAAA